MILWIFLHVLINDLTRSKIKYAISNWYATCIQTALDSIVCFLCWFTYSDGKKKWDNKEQWSKFWQQQQQQQQQQQAHQILLIVWLVMKHYKWQQSNMMVGIDDLT